MLFLDRSSGSPSCGRSQVFAQSVAGPADPRQYGAQRHAEHFGRLLVGQLGDHDQDQGVLQFRRQSVQGTLHLVGQFVAARIFGREFDFQALVVGHEAWWAGASPVVGHTTPEDRGQPSPAAAFRPEEIAALPGRAEGLLDQVLGLMAIPHKAVCQAVHRWPMVGDHAIEFRNGKRHSDVSLAPPHAGCVARISG